MLSVNIVLDEYLTGVFSTDLILGQLPGPKHLQRIPLFGLAATTAVHSVPLFSAAPSGAIITPGVQPPVVICPSLPPIPGKLVAKVVSGAFVEMLELLPNNIMLCRQLEIQDKYATSMSHSSKPPLREVQYITLWVCCNGHISGHTSFSRETDPRPSGKH